MNNRSNKIIRPNEGNEADNAFYWVNLLNSISGVKSANLIGTCSPEGLENLALFSSVVHIGANPPLLGMVMRPLTVGRQTYDYIARGEHYTINHVHESIMDRAHWTSAKFAEDQSEFVHCGLTPGYIDGFTAPYVQESNVNIGLRWVEEYMIKANGAIMIIGEVLWIKLDISTIGDDGNIDLAALGTVGIGGLEQYYSLTRKASYAYARPQILPINLL